MEIYDICKKQEKQKPDIDKIYQFHNSVRTNNEIANAKLAIVVNPLTIPLRTSIEFIVFPVIGIINTTKAKYKDGILTEPNNGKSRFESYAPNKSIGAAQNASARGLNQPPWFFYHLLYQQKILEWML